MSYRIPDALIAEENARLAPAQAEDYAALGRRLERAGVDVETVTARVAAFAVAIPTWGVGTGGTRFARFPGVGEPREIFDKLEDCATIHQLTRATPTCSPHFPWDRIEDYRELVQFAAALGVGFDAVNSNTFQDQDGQALSYKFGSLAHSERAVRDQAVAHNVECIEIGEKLGSKALTVWIADGSNFPGQSNLNRVFDRYLEFDGRDLRAAPSRLARVHRAQAVRAGVLLDRHFRLGNKPHGGPGAGTEGQLPRRSRAPCAERQYRADRRAADPGGQACGFSFQRLKIWRR